MKTAKDMRNLTDAKNENAINFIKNLYEEEEEWIVKAAKQGKNQYNWRSWFFTNSNYMNVAVQLVASLGYTYKILDNSTLTLYW